ncbi:MAG: ATP-binding protein [Moorea sp. SIO3G5]|nr:ATP-binding protein [Moorena sp. SIO3G5]
MTYTSDLLENLYNAFDPSQPLPAGDPVYVDCREVRGDGEIQVDLGKEMLLSKRETYHLYGGHRGAGKSTELLRLKQYLEQNNFYVVYFAADEEDVDSEDTQYTDILLACTRHLLEDLKDSANPRPLLNWLESRWQELKDLALTEIAFDGLSAEAKISQYGKLTANLRAVPTLRQQIRQKINPHTVTLLKALNQFITEAKQNLPAGCTKLAVIADNLDRIVPVIQESNQTNHEEIFLDRSEQLKGLKCHIVYTVPISMLYSKRTNDLRDIYGDAQVLPMIMVRTKEGNLYQPGFNKVKEVISKRVGQFAPTRSLETDIFESPEALERLCLMSGGHVRNLLLLIQTAIARTETLPISLRAVQRSITDARDTYRRTVQDGQWSILADVYRSKQIHNNDQYRQLLFNRCLLEYQYFDDEGERQCWYDVHPLIKGIKQFQDACAQLDSQP